MAQPCSPKANQTPSVLTCVISFDTLQANSNHLTVISDGRTVALRGQHTRVGRFLLRQSVAVRRVFDGYPFANRNVGLVLSNLGVSASNISPNVCVARKHREVQVAGALPAAGGGMVQCLFG